jgi:hypothetical protein
MTSPFLTLWYYMNERESIRLKKAAGAPRPWTKDEILNTYKFVNVKRLHDRTTQWALNNWYKPHADRPLGEQLFNCAVFRYFGTMEFAKAVDWQSTGYWQEWLEKNAAQMLATGEKVFTGAYIITSGGSSGPKYQYVVRKVLKPFYERRNAIAELAQQSRSWQQVAELMYKLPGFGGSGFMTKEVLQDALLTPVFRGVRDASTWTPIGPGARRGLNRLYGRFLHERMTDEIALEQIRYLLKLAPKHVSRNVMALDLTAHDIQFALCEVDKYMRVKNGEGRPRSLYTPTEQA